MAKGFVIFSALLVLGAAAPQNRVQNDGTRLQDRLTSMEWEQLGNTIEEVFGIASERERNEQQEQQEAGDIGQASGDRQSERMREFIKRQRTDPAGAARLEDREERNREAIGRAQGRLPEREAQRRQMAPKSGRQQRLQQVSLQKERQWEQDQGHGAKHFNSFPLYEFAYGVYDPVTGDKKEQWEKRVGDHVKGTYTLDQPNGKTRIVEYEADDKRGFEAVVNEVDQSKDPQRGNVKWGHSDRDVAQSYTKLKKVD